MERRGWDWSGGVWWCVLLVSLGLFSQLAAGSYRGAMGEILGCMSVSDVIDDRLLLID